MGSLIEYNNQFQLISPNTAPPKNTYSLFIQSLLILAFVHLNPLIA